MFRLRMHYLLAMPILASLFLTPLAWAADPPARPGVVVMDNQGRVLKTLQAPATREELAARAADEEKQRDKAKVDAEQTRKDRILLDSYTTEAEIDLARNRASQALDQQMEIARNYTASLARRKAELQKLKAEAGAKGLPPADAQELARVQVELDVQSASLVQKKQDLDRILARYAADKRRWQEIGEKQGAARPVAVTAIPAR